MDKEAFRQIRDWLGITYREDKPTVIRSLRKLTAEGVYSEDLYSEMKEVIEKLYCSEPMS